MFWVDTGGQLAMLFFAWFEVYIKQEEDINDVIEINKHNKYSKKLSSNMQKYH